MTYEEMLEMMAGYYKEDGRLDDELDYATSKPAYASYGLGVKEAYEEFISSIKYDE